MIWILSLKCVYKGLIDISEGDTASVIPMKAVQLFEIFSKIRSIYKCISSNTQRNN